uniref:Phospholipase A2 n=1 Tax=Sparus aurata TaxID=8175 RepID=A0A671X8Q5_SPAAU
MNVSGPLLLLLTAACMVSGAMLPRALWQFGSMIQCAQPGVNPLLYNDYGCWCGFGGTGTPLDDLDMCCKVHDNCYKASRLTPGCTAIADLPYVLVYDHTCSNQQVTCSGENKPGASTQTVGRQATNFKVIFGRLKKAPVFTIVSELKHLVGLKGQFTPKSKPGVLFIFLDC